jgi:hypothetical protein
MVVVSGNVVSAGTISSPWTPVTGPPADSNGAGPDTKNLDVGDVSDVSVSTSPITTSDTITKPTNRRTKANFISFPLAFRMKRIWRRQMRKECGVPTSNRVFRKHLQYILLVDDGKLYYQMKAKCMDETN